MFDKTQHHGQFIEAAMQLASTQPWRTISIADIAAKAGLTEVDFKKAFSSKPEMLAAFSQAVDAEVLKKVGPSRADDQEVPRDRLFDVIMTRFEVMTPYKAALKNIHRDLRGGLNFGDIPLTQFVNSQYWMLAAAGIPANGSRGILRVPGLLAVYSSAISVWLQDDDPGLAKTMAVLDRRLRRGENMLERVEAFCVQGCNALKSLRSAGVSKSDDTVPSETKEKPATPPPSKGDEPGPAAMGEPSAG